MDIDEHKPKFDKIIDHLKLELSAVRTNRATPALVEHVKVAAYEGSQEQSIKELAAISVPEPRQLLVEPWDKTIVKPIEDALHKYDFGFSVANEGQQLRLSIPSMTDEVRQQVLKVVPDKLEAARISLRQQRDSLKDEINKKEKSHEIGEDEKFSSIDKLDEMSKEYTDRIKELGESKEKEIAN